MLEEAQPGDGAPDGQHQPGGHLDAAARFE